MKDKNDYIEAAQQIIISLGLPKAQHNERSALCLLALLDLTPGKSWADAGNPLIGITPIMDWARDHFDKAYKPNTRESVRRQTMHQFCDAGLALYNPDKPDRPVNSPKAVYQIEPSALVLLRTFGTPAWHDSLVAYLAERETLVARYAKEREQNRIPVEIAPGQQITLSPGEHSELIRDIIEDFAPRFAPGSVLIYAGDTGDKWVTSMHLCWPDWVLMWIRMGRCPMWCCTLLRKTGCYWWSLSPATARSMVSAIPSWRSYSPDRPPG